MYRSVFACLMAGAVLVAATISSHAQDEEETPTRKGPSVVYMTVTKMQVLKPDTEFSIFHDFVTDSYPMDQWQHDYELSNDQKRQIVFYTHDADHPIQFLHETAPEAGIMIFGFFVQAIGDDGWEKVRDRLDMEEEWHTQAEPEAVLTAETTPDYSLPVAETEGMPTLYFRVLISLVAYDKTDGDYAAVTQAIDEQKGPHSWYRQELDDAKSTFILYTAKPTLALDFVDNAARANGYFIIGAAAEPVKKTDWDAAAKKMGVTEKPPYGMLEKAKK